MSYSIFFNSETGKGNIKKGTYLNYFKTRANYTVSGDQAWYENEVTGTYFSFFIRIEHDIEFDINVLRPHYFCLEANQEILAFLRAFPSTMYDPQLEIQGKFDENKFFEKWQENNKAACKIAKSGSYLPDHRFLPTALLNKFWKWNYGIDDLINNTLRDLDVFIPQLMLYEGENGNIKLLSLWPEALPVVLPRDIDVMIGTSEQSLEKPTLHIVEYTLISNLIKKYEEPQSNQHYAVINYSKVPEDITALFQSKPSKLIQSNCLLHSGIIINSEHFDNQPTSCRSLLKK
ncbi:MAG: hypothetical protein K2X02_08425 [Alphaproteobacteria bacterium]|nr:hypothetical protein [Alphaproteobacteria bacterium]